MHVCVYVNLHTGSVCYWSQRNHNEQLLQSPTWFSWLKSEYGDLISGHDSGKPHNVSDMNTNRTICLALPHQWSKPSLVRWPNSIQLLTMLFFSSFSGLINGICKVGFICSHLRNWKKKIKRKRNGLVCVCVCNVSGRWVLGEQLSTRISDSWYWLQFFPRFSRLPEFMDTNEEY